MRSVTGYAAGGCLIVRGVKATAVDRSLDGAARRCLQPVD
jgi:hypothetical protein